MHDEGDLLGRPTGTTISTLGFIGPLTVSKQ
jgi:hypothetical protein